MAKRTVRFGSPTMYAGVCYGLNQVVELDNNARKALGDTVEAADDVNVEEEAEKLERSTRR